jgi:hypothetical protein
VKRNAGAWNGMRGMRGLAGHLHGTCAVEPNRVEGDCAESVDEVTKGGRQQVRRGHTEGAFSAFGATWGFSLRINRVQSHLRIDLRGVIIVCNCFVDVIVIPLPK